MRVQSRGEMAEERTIQRLPVAAMDENHEVALATRRKHVDGVARARPVRDGVKALLLAPSLCVARPAGDQRRMFGHPRAVVIFGLVVDFPDHNRHPPCLARSRRTGPPPASQNTASITCAALPSPLRFKQPRSWREFDAAFSMRRFG